MDASVGDGAVDGQPDTPPDTPLDGPNITCDAATAITCNGQCVDSLSPAHCGSCTNVCPTAPAHSHATCTAPSTCGVACDTGYSLCNGTCHDNAQEPSADACVVTDSVGVFVAPNGSDSAACTKAAPCKTIAHGISVAHAASKRVYVCEGTYDEQLVVDASVDGAKVFGGFACGTWTYDANKKPVVAPSAHGNALVLSGTTSALFEDFAFQAQGGSAAGESSIVVFAKNAQGVVMRRCSVTAGAGIAGQDATQPAPYSSAAPNGNSGALGNGGGVASNPACSSSTGGAGGAPGPTGNDGSDGTPGASNKGTVGGCQMSGASGGNGTTGSLGSVGLGTTAWATFNASGWMPMPGGAGGTGTVGQGGGGGASLDLMGGGGGGGAGGCGGSGGGAGGGAGSSVAILSLSSSVDLESSALTAGNAGRGGNGALGQTGQSGGLRGTGFAASNACSGGRGGNGGNGGTGGGGAGGLSAGIVWVGTAPTVNGVSTPSATTLTGFSTGSAGTGGTGGSAGKAGVAAAVVQFQ